MDVPDTQAPVRRSHKKLETDMILITPTYSISGYLDPSRRREAFSWQCLPPSLTLYSLASGLVYWLGRCLWANQTGTSELSYSY